MAPYRLLKPYKIGFFFILQGFCPIFRYLSCAFFGKNETKNKLLKDKLIHCNQQKHCQYKKIIQNTNNYFIQLADLIINTIYNSYKDKKIVKNIMPYLKPKNFKYNIFPKIKVSAERQIKKAKKKIEKEKITI